MLSKDLARTIKKIQKIDIKNEKEVDGDSTVLQINYNNEDFFIFIKPILDEEMVINVVNPISFTMENLKGIELEMANNFNGKAVGSKCILIDAEKNHYLFCREEIVRNKDIFNKELVEAKFNSCIKLVIKAVAVFEELITDEEADNEQEEEQ
ncbi:hypothetical protein [Pantoea agglomerans]|uniref:hypothetical protein n=1 Tax=Enterobacter agglomerans TaxID=549 RepID=UPI0032087C59